MQSSAPGTSDIPRRLPRGSHGLDRDVVEASQRTRLLEAVGRAVAERGYSGATIDDVVRRAGVSKQTFYDHFADKQDCFLAAYEAASEELLERVGEAQDGSGRRGGGCGGGAGRRRTARRRTGSSAHGPASEPTCVGWPPSPRWRACS